MQPSRMIEAAERYAAGDKSDPFCLARCKMHIERGLCTPLQDGTDGHYDAQAVPEGRVTATGEHYVATVYHNMARP